MSHELEVIDGFAQAMFERVAWHRLGTVVGDTFGWADAVSEGLSITFPVVKVPLQEVLSSLPYGDGFDGPSLRAQTTDHVAVRSDGLIIASGLGEQWTPFHAVEGYAFGQAIREQAKVDGIRADLKSLGTIQEGRKWFMTFDLGEFSIGDYAVRDYLSVNGSYDSSWPLQVLSSPTIEVCANTIAAAQAAGVKHYRFKHTSGIFDRVEEAKRALIGHAQNRAVFKALGETLLTRAVSPVEYGQLCNALFPTTDDVPTKTRNVNAEARDKVTSLYKATSGPQVVANSGNAWAFVQAVNTYENWGSPIRKTGNHSEADTRAMRQIDALTSGKQPLTDQAFALVG
jgi:phage/plasmid-like protein (TIGR03299 family)